MKGYTSNIEKDTIDNTDFRRVLYTAKFSQLVLMSLKPGEEIGSEVHDLDQFLRIEKGTGTGYLNNESFPVEDGTAVVVPAGVEHNIVNTGSEDLKLYTLYTPPEHKDQTVHTTKEDALNDTEDHFDGKTTQEV